MIKTKSGNFNRNKIVFLLLLNPTVYYFNNMKSQTLLIACKTLNMCRPNFILDSDVKKC